MVVVVIADSTMTVMGVGAAADNMTMDTAAEVSEATEADRGGMAGVRVAASPGATAEVMAALKVVATAVTLREDRAGAGAWPGGVEGDTVMAATPPWREPRAAR
jgi:hypothetical protein